MKRWRVTVAAQSDLREIGRYTQNRWGRRSRIRYLNGLREAFDRLADNPLLGQYRPDTLDGLRSLQVGSHVVFYRLDESSARVTILRILHQAMDPRSRLQ